MDQPITITITLELPDWAEFVALDYVSVHCFEQRPVFDSNVGTYGATGSRHARVVQSSGPILTTAEVRNSENA